MESFYSHTVKYYFTDLILISVLIVALVYSLQKGGNYKLFRFFPLYISSLIIVYVANKMSLFATLKEIMKPICSYGDYFVTLLELAVFSHFFFNSVSNPLVKKIIIYSNFFFLPYYLYMAITDASFYPGISENTQAKVYTVEAVLLTLFCTCYFYELFRNLSSKDLVSEPTFWVACGVLFFMVCTLPYSILENYIEKYYRNVNYHLYAIYYVFYILLFLLMIKAYKCASANFNASRNSSIV
jgi:hypothetical protein